jgi:coenzyme F420-reducing hydrogenase alpha subunit
VLQHQWGNDLISRLVARLTEMAQIARDLLDDTENPISDMSQNWCKIQGSGIGVVSAARGLLIHHVSIEHDQIKKYQILAPTEWNFHPQGVVAQSLACLQGDAEQIKIQAGLLINAIDPCVGYKFHIV